MARQRSCLTFEVEHPINFLFLERHNPIFYLGNGAGISTEYLALGSISQIETNATNPFEELRTFRKTIQDWSFGWLNYDLKNELEDLTSNNPAQFNNAKLVFVQPELVFKIQPSEGKLKVQCHFFPEVSTKDKVQNLISEIWKESKPTDDPETKVLEKMAYLLTLFSRNLVAFFFRIYFKYFKFCIGMKGLLGPAHLYQV